MKKKLLVKKLSAFPILRRWYDDEMHPCQRMIDEGAPWNIRWNTDKMMKEPVGVLTDLYIEALEERVSYWREAYQRATAKVDLVQLELQLKDVQAAIERKKERLFELGWSHDDEMNMHREETT